MSDILPTIATLGVLFISTLTRSTLGFGDALVAMPFLVIVLGLRTATPLVALVATLISAVILIRNWQIVDFRITWRLILSAACGIPVGLFYLTQVPESLMQALLGILLIGFSLYNLIQPSLAFYRVPHHLAYGFGFVAGMLGGAYNIVGPLLVMYGHLRRWSPEQFRATLQSCFFPAYGCIVIGHAVAGLLTPQVFTLFGLALPLVILAIGLGNKLHAAIPQRFFLRAVNIALLLIGLLLCVRSTATPPDADIAVASPKEVAPPHLLML
ncbi:MAG: sulfite exporter TauE/SafE family protein [Candidatus Tectomicrobia bacterium]|nr:sulfite exporter TauE/SafE family protein [Candidatus Tectomicrobia bacterium]